MAELIDIISQNTQSTVVAEYERENRDRDGHCAGRCNEGDESGAVPEAYGTIRR